MQSLHTLNCTFTQTIIITSTKLYMIACTIPQRLIHTVGFFLLLLIDSSIIQLIVLAPYHKMILVLKMMYKKTN